MCMRPRWDDSELMEVDDVSNAAAEDESDDEDESDSDLIWW